MNHTGFYFYFLGYQVVKIQANTHTHTLIRSYIENVDKTSFRKLSTMFRTLEIRKIKTKETYIPTEEIVGPHMILQIHFL
jgi:hypothetical protein